MVVTPRYADYENAEYSGVCVRVMDTEVGYHTLKRNGVDFVFVDNPCYPRVGVHRVKNLIPKLSRQLDVEFMHPLCISTPVPTLLLNKCLHSLPCRWPLC